MRVTNDHWHEWGPFHQRFTQLMFWSLISIWDDRASGIIGLASIQKESQTKNSKKCLVCQLRKFANLHLQMHPVLECKVHVNDIKHEREESMCSANPEETFLHDNDIWNADSAWLCESQWPTRRQGGAIVESLPGSRVAAKKAKTQKQNSFSQRGRAMPVSLGKSHWVWPADRG